VGFILNISLMDGQYDWDVVESNTDPKRHLEFAGLVVPEISPFL